MKEELGLAGRLILIGEIDVGEIDLLEASEGGALDLLGQNAAMFLKQSGFGFYGFVSFQTLNLQVEFGRKGVAQEFGKREITHFAELIPLSERIEFVCFLESGGQFDLGYHFGGLVAKCEPLSESSGSILGKLMRKFGPSFHDGISSQRAMMEEAFQSEGIVAIEAPHANEDGLLDGVAFLRSGGFVQMTRSQDRSAGQGCFLLQEEIAHPSTL